MTCIMAQFVYPLFSWSVFTRPLPYPLILMCEQGGYTDAESVAVPGPPSLAGGVTVSRCSLSDCRLFPKPFLFRRSSHSRDRPHILLSGHFCATAALSQVCVSHAKGCVELSREKIPERYASKLFRKRGRCCFFCPSFYKVRGERCCSRLPPLVGQQLSNFIVISSDQR